MSDSNGSQWGCAAFGVCVGLVIFACYYFHEKDDKKQREDEAQKKLIEKEEYLKRAGGRIDDLVKKYDAVTDWPELLGFGTHWQDGLVGAANRGAFPYTFRAQAVLIGKDSRPIVLFGRIGDIEMQNGMLVLTCYDWKEDSGLVFVLECDIKLAEAIVLSASNPDGNFSPMIEEFRARREERRGAPSFHAFAVIARIISVRRATSPVSASDFEVWNPPEAVLVARGQCLDLVDLDSLRSIAQGRVPPLKRSPPSDEP